jgi:hypothetical protein
MRMRALITVPATGVVLSRAAPLLVACAAVFVMAGRAAAQDGAAEASDSGVVVRIHSASVTPGAPQGSPLNQFFGLLAEYTKPLVGWGVVDLEDLGELLEDLHGELTPESSTMNYVVSLKGDRMRVDMGGSSLLAALTPDGSVAEWAVLDPASGRVINSDAFDTAILRDNFDPYAAVPGVFEIRDSKISPGGGAREIHGFTAQRYTYAYRLDIYPAGKGEQVPVIMVLTKGSAWIAPGGPDVDRDVAVVFRNWAEGFGNQGNGKSLAQQGLLLGADETKTVTIGLTQSDEAGIEVLQGSASFDVTDISRQPLDDAQFSGFERGETGCDCSCDAWKELQAIGEMSREEQEAHPKAMTLSMCAPKCATTWMKCPKN